MIASRPWACAAFPKAKSAGFARRSFASRLASVAVIIAVGVNSEGRREVLARAIGPFEAATFRTDFRRQLRRGDSTTVFRSKPLG